MNNKSLLIVFIFFVSCLMYGQTSNNKLNVEFDTNNKIEDFILRKQLDSSLTLLKKNKSTPYRKKLLRIATNNNPSVLDFQSLISNLENRDDILYLQISNYIENSILEPKNSNKIDLNYVKLKWHQVSNLRDDVSLDDASKVQTNLDNYINQFPENENDVLRAKVFSSTHQIVLYGIQRDIENGKALIQKNIEISKALNDKELELISLYYLTDFLVFEGKLDEFIATCELSLEIENTLKEKSSYYFPTLIHIIDAYIYKGGYNTQVENLLTTLYSNNNDKERSYSLYAKYLGVLDKNSSSFEAILNRFEVANLVAFSNKVSALAEPVLNPNEFYQLKREISNTLHIHKYFEEAISYKDKTIVLIKNIYSKDLANALAGFKTEQAVKEKDLIIDYQNERFNFYIIIGVLVLLLLTIAILAFLIKQKQSKVLALKNTQIQKTLKEKELLVREVHHRVKNNFQIVSSLLELQAKDIDDVKAKKLANDGKNRVKSMALIHQKLYQNKDGLIDFEEYLKQLVNELSSLYKTDNVVKTTIIAQNIRFDVDTAIPLGLIINELITNAYKYAFKGVNNGALKVSLKKIDKELFELEIEDSGNGFKPDFNIKKVKSLGLRLVTRLVKQLQGDLVADSTNGAKFTITFKDVLARKRVDESAI